MSPRDLCDCDTHLVDRGRGHESGVFLGRVQSAQSGEPDAVASQETSAASSSGVILAP